MTLKTLPADRFNYRFEIGDEVEPRQPLWGMEEEQCLLDFTFPVKVYEVSESKEKLKMGIHYQIIYLKGTKKGGENIPFECPDPFWAGDYKLKGQGFFPVKEKEVNITGEKLKAKAKEVKTIQFKPK